MQTADGGLVEVLLVTIEDVDIDDGIGPGVSCLRNLQGALDARSFRDDGDNILHRESHRRAQVGAIATRHIREVLPGDTISALLRSME